MQGSSEIPFRFQFINQSGNTVGWRSQPGQLTEQSIQLKDLELSYNAVLESTTRDQRLVLSVDPTQIHHEDLQKNLIQGRTLILQVTSAKPLELERHIDRVSSFYLAERHHQTLIQQGQGEAFRTCICPQCEATIDVSLLNKSPFIYCRFCESISEDNGPVITNGENYRQCDECQWFDRVQGYTVFYFYFLLVVYGFSYRRRHLCDTCMNKVFWKALLINFVFLLGIFPTLWMKFKSASGRNPDFKELANANALGKKGKIQRGTEHYNTLYNRHPGHPGVLYSHALSQFKAQSADEGWSLLEQSLQNCSNYAPTIRMINRIQDRAQEKAAAQ